MKRIAIFFAVLVAAMTLSMTAALASVAPSGPPVTQGAGSGQSKLSAAFGFNMDLNLQGQFEYNADPNGPNAGFMAHCSGYSSVMEWQSWDGFPALRFLSETCTDQDGKPVYLRGKIIDRGEPGVANGDYAHILWGYTLPVTLHNYYISDNGKILSGNIQILHF
jgi:hypothetical protein